MPKVIPRQLGHKVAIKMNSYVPADDGSTTKTPSVVARRHATITPLSSKELFEAQQVGAEATHRIRMRWDTFTDGVLGGTHWLEPSIGTRVFEIVGSMRNEDERNMFIIGECKVKEGA